jgi:hypothetical protein
VIALHHGQAQRAAAVQLQDHGTIKFQIGRHQLRSSHHLPRMVLSGAG